MNDARWAQAACGVWSCGVSGVFVISTKLWIHTAARYPPQCETQCLREGSSQQMKIQPNAFWMYPLQAIQFQNFLCVLDLLIICSSLQYISFCPDLYLLATFSAVLATIVSWLVFFLHLSSFAFLQCLGQWHQSQRAPAMPAHMTQHPSNIWHCNVQGPIPSTLAEYTHVWTCLSGHWMLDAWICFFPPSPHSLRSLDDMMTPVKQKEEDQSKVTPTKTSPCKVANEAVAKEAKGAPTVEKAKVPKAKAKAKAGTKDTQCHRGRCSTKAKGIQWCGWFWGTQEAASC